MVKAKELDELDAEELDSRLVEVKAELFNLRFQHVTGQLDNYARLPQLRHDLARIMTVMRAREIQAAEEEQVQ